MRIKETGLMLAIAVLLTVAAVPALAASPAAPDAGTFLGVADVGKTGTCNADGTVTGLSGQGIGLLPVIDAKNAVYRINAPEGTATSILHGAGALKLCGYLTAPLHGAAGPGTPDTKILGATCAATKGWGGKGVATFPGHTVTLTDLGWKATVGGTFLVTADASGNGKAADTLVAVVQTLSETAVLGCTEKTVANSTSGKGTTTDTFDVIAGYTILPGDLNPSKAPKK